VLGKWVHRGVVQQVRWEEEEREEEEEEEERREMKGGREEGWALVRAPYSLIQYCTVQYRTLKIPQPA
jgi:hypothetical protein